ncbi:MAG: CHAT domain-containing protein [Thermoanaerobaculia bacterium]|nr:CHAT domain-containing protein [Thermoanaerobaculia bacterium]
MGSVFDLVLSADAETWRAELRLEDGHGGHLAFREVAFKSLPTSRVRALFELSDYLRIYVEPEHKRAEVEKLGVMIAEEVLGAEIFGHLWRPESPRTLCVRLPGDGENPLVAALARLPWEIARPRPEAESLFERNLVVRVVHEGGPPVSAPLALGPDASLRVLVVFAEARGSTPLGARRERRALQKLFREKVYPGRKVEVDFLVHGVTRERLAEQLEEHGGYHVVHWSGHGQPNGLELAGTGGRSDVISAPNLLALFRKAGGFLPRFVFLSACHSGEVVRGWADFEAVAQGREPGGRGVQAPVRDLDLTAPPGLTGTAHAFLAAGVPAVVAMRDSVGDDYARELALDFYDSVFAAAKPKTVATALNQARKALLRGDGARYSAADPATPVLFGAEDAGLKLPPGRSPALDGRDRRLHRLAELTLSSHEHFVGRVWELDGLGAEFIGTTKGAEVKPVAVITGLGGMGKTALVAEVIDLWEGRFAWVATYQAKPNVLGFDAFLRDLNLSLRGEMGIYHQHVESHPAAAIYRDASTDFTGEERRKRLIQNLVRALRDEPILLVLDNFETNLKPTAEEASVDGEPVWKCQDPAWDELLTELASGLRGSGSRVLVTSRWLPAALAGGKAHRVPLGPLPAGEAQLYLREHRTLWPMFYGTDEKEKQLAHRLLAASRFHPLLMDRLAKLTATPELRPQLEQVLVSLESRRGFEKLPELFSVKPGDTNEIAYLEDALETSIDQLIAGASPDARRLLWMIAVANEPVALGLVREVWGVGPDIEALLRHLVGVGLVTEERGPDGVSSGLSCHELVRERALAWGREKAEELGGKTENAVRLGYAAGLEGAFRALLHKNMTLALEAGRRALVYCVQAEAWEQLGGFASRLVTSASDPRFLAGLVPHFQNAAESAPGGKVRWCCLTYLADALGRSGQPDASLGFYEQAAGLARDVAEKRGEGARQAWDDLAAISGNWAIALAIVGQLDGARRRQLESADASWQAGSPEVQIVASELEALRIDIMQGRVEEVLPAVEERLARLAGWWRKNLAGEALPEAPNAEDLARTYIGALDVADDADRARQAWQSALTRVDAMLEVKQALRRPAEDLASTRMNRANVLVRLSRLGEAQAELEACLEAFNGDPAGKAMVWGSLANVFDGQGDLPQAIQLARRALALHSQLPEPLKRAISHSDLASYLGRKGDLGSVTEMQKHQMADLTYCLVGGLFQSLRGSFRNYDLFFRRAHAAGTEPTIPRLSDLLADPAFDSLKTWLESRQVDLGELQAEIDQFLDQARQAALAEP